MGVEGTCGVQSFSSPAGILHTLTPHPQHYSQCYYRRHTFWHPTTSPNCVFGLVEIEAVDASRPTVYRTMPGSPSGIQSGGTDGQASQIPVIGDTAAPQIGTNNRHGI